MGKWQVWLQIKGNAVMADNAYPVLSLRIENVVPLEEQETFLICFVRSLLGSAACPKEGTTNLHLDMSDAVNVMVSKTIST